MGSVPWKDAYVDRVLGELDGQRVQVKAPDGSILAEGRLLGDGSSGSTRCLIVNTATEREWQEWHDAPDAAARGRLAIFDQDVFIPLARGIDVNGVVA